MKRFISMILGATIAAGLTAYGYQAQSVWPPALQPASDTSPVLSPDAAMKTMIMPPGYHLELVASEPLIQDPVFIDWDADGRMWAIEMPGYMIDITATRELEPLGRIVVLRGHERRRQDGQAHGVRRRPGAGPRAEGPRTRRARGRAAEPLADARHQRRSEDGQPGSWSPTPTAAATPTSSTTRTGCSGRWTTRIYTSETDTYLGCERWHSSRSNKTLSRGQWGLSQDDAGRMYRNSNSSALHVDLVPTRVLHAQPDACCGRAAATNSSARTATTSTSSGRFIRRAASTAATRTACFASRRHTGVVHRGRGAHHLSRRSAAGRTVTATPSSPSRPPISSAGSSSTTTERRCGGGRPTRAVSSSRRPTSGSGRSTCPPRPTARSTSSTCIAASSSTRASSPSTCRDQILSRHLEQPTGLGRVYRVVHDTTKRDSAPALSKAPVRRWSRRSRIRTDGGVTRRSACSSSETTSRRTRPAEAGDRRDGFSHEAPRVVDAGRHGQHRPGHRHSGARRSAIETCARRRFACRNDGFGSRGSSCTRRWSEVDDRQRLGGQRAARRIARRAAGGRGSGAGVVLDRAQPPTRLRRTPRSAA